jgi:hypothetical protein
VIMVIATGGAGNLEDRLSLVSQMLEEAVELLRSTMTEVREEARGEPDGNGDDPRPDRHPVDR